MTSGNLERRTMAKKTWLVETLREELWQKNGVSKRKNVRDFFSFFWGFSIPRYPLRSLPVLFFLFLGIFWDQGTHWGRYTPSGLPSTQFLWGLGSLRPVFLTKLISFTTLPLHGLRCLLTNLTPRDLPHEFMHMLKVSVRQNTITDSITFFLCKSIQYHKRVLGK